MNNQVLLLFQMKCPCKNHDNICKKVNGSLSLRMARIAYYLLHAAIHLYYRNQQYKIWRVVKKRRNMCVAVEL